ncbi:MAG: fumarylacetoacetate hydrolase family protein [Pseudomonadota bacterium]
MNPSVLAEKLLTARIRREKVELAPQERPTNWDEARQTAALCLRDQPYGWKLGATNQAGRDTFGLTRPIYGGLDAHEIYEAGKDVIVPSLPAPLAEPEIVVRLGDSVAPIDTPRSDEEILALIDGVCAAVEFPSTCLLSPETEGVLSFVADRAGVGFLALGEFAPAETLQTLGNANTQLILDGMTVAEGNSNLLIGGVFGALRGFFVETGKEGRALHPNDVISTGGLCEALPLGQAASVGAVIEGLPEAHFRLSYA